MPYDDPILKELGGYFKAEEPGRRARADAWATAIGLQKVDGLTPSQFLLDTAKDHIEGRITQNQARRRIHDYYAAQAEVAWTDPDKEEADKVSFGEGNTRTTAVFTIKYLRSLGFAVDNDAFRDNAWYFRNALVRANFADYAHDVKREWCYLEAFFRNLLLGERNELKSRYLLIGLMEEDKQKIRELTEGGGDHKKVVRKSGKKTTQKTARKTAARTTQKTASEILSVLRRNPDATRKDLVAVTGLTEDGVKWNLRKLKVAGRLRRIGPDKGGHWEVVEGGGE